MRVWLCLVLVACSYTPHPGGTAPAGDGASADSPGPGGDGGGGDGSGADATPACTVGERVCVDATHSGACDANLAPVTDRDCPPGSMCSAGYCAPPPGAASCTEVGECSNGQVCDLYVVSNALVGFCTDPFGGNTGGCSVQGNDPSCDTGLCGSRSDGSDRRCLDPCVASCSGSGLQCSSLGQPTVIEGVSTVGQSYCRPD